MSRYHGFLTPAPTNWKGSLLLGTLLLCIKWALASEPRLVIQASPVVLPVTELAPWRLLDGAGKRVARNLGQYQRMVMPVRCLDDLRHVPGIGPRRLHQWMPWLRPLR